MGKSLNFYIPDDLQTTERLQGPFIPIYKNPTDEKPIDKVRSWPLLVDTKRGHTWSNHWVTWVLNADGQLSGFVATVYQLNDEIKKALNDIFRFTAHRTENIITILTRVDVADVEARGYPVYFAAVRQYFTEKYNLSPVTGYGYLNDRFELNPDPLIWLKPYSPIVRLGPDYLPEPVRVDAPQKDEATVLQDRIVLLQQQGMNQRAIAGEVGLSQSTVGRIIRSLNAENRT